MYRWIRRPVFYGLLDDRMTAFFEKEGIAAVYRGFT
jgi:hypothetical protein